MGSPKALLKTGDSTFLEHILDAYASLSIECVVVLPASEADEIVRSASLHRTRHAVNPDRDGDRLSSLRCGLREVRAGHRVFVQDVDRPVVSVDLLDAMLHADEGDGYSAPLVNGRGGHPLLLSPTVVEALVRGASGPTLRDVLAPFRRLLVELPAGHEELNINTPDDYRRFIDRSLP